MATLAFSSVTPRIIPYATGCPIPVAEIAIREAAIEFCELSYAWRADMTAINVVSGTSSYSLASALPVAGSEVVQLLVVRYDGVELPPLVNVDVRSEYPEHPDTVNTSPALYYQFTDPQTIDLVPVPDTNITGGLEIFAVLRPARTATGMDQSVLTKWSSVIELGALYRLLSMPEKNWSNPKQADHYGHRFMAQCAAANAQARKGYTRRSLQVRIPKFV